MDINVEISNRIRLVVDSKTRGSVNAFAKEIGLKQATISNYVNGSRMPSYEFLYALLSTYTDVSCEWLILGEGSMYKSASAGTINTVNVDAKHNTGVVDAALVKNGSDDLRTEIQELRKELAEQKEEHKRDVDFYRQLLLNNK